MNLIKLLSKLFQPKRRRVDIYHHDITPLKKKTVIYPQVLSNAITMSASSINGRVKYS